MSRASARGGRRVHTPTASKHPNPKRLLPRTCKSPTVRIQLGSALVRCRPVAAAGMGGRRPRRRPGRGIPPRSVANRDAESPVAHGDGVEGWAVQASSPPLLHPDPTITLSSATVVALGSIRVAHRASRGLAPLGEPDGAALVCQRGGTAGGHGAAPLSLPPGESGGAVDPDRHSTSTTACRVRRASLPPRAGRATASAADWGRGGAGHTSSHDGARAPLGM